MIFKVDGKTYTLKAPDDLTLADYRAIVTPPPSEDDLKATHEWLIEVVRRCTKIPKTKLRQVAFRDLSKALEVAAEYMDRILKAKPDPETYTPPETITYRGTTYTVPQDIEGLPFGQYESVMPALQAAEYEPDCYAALLGVFLVPEGEEWDASKAGERIAMFDGLPMTEAVGVCSFFTEQSDALRKAMHLSLTRCLTRRASAEVYRVLRSTPPDTGSMPEAIGPQS